MTIKGHFIDLDGNKIEVTIETPNGFSTQEIGSNGLYFSDDEPVMIEEDFDDNFEAVIRKTATINLVTKNYQGGNLFAGNKRDVKVTITRGSECVFYGYVEPETFNQPFAYLHDEFTLNCVDCLSTLDAYRYNDATAANYDECVSKSDKVSFLSVIQKALSPFGCAVMYDCSKRTKVDSINIFNELGINETIIYGEGADDVWTYQECLENILTYLGLHIRQEGKVFYIFDWESIKKQNNTWVSIIGSSHSRSAQEYVITKDMYRSDATNISMASVYNQIKINVSTDDEENLLVQVFDDDFTNSLYSGKQRYCSEYWVEGDRGTTARADIAYMLMGSTPLKSEKAYENRWFMRSIYNPAWKFNIPSSAIYSGYGGSLGKQDNVPNFLKTHNYVATLLQLGKIKQEGSYVNGEDRESPDMSNYIYISVNGDETNNPSDSALRALESNPIITYEGASGGAVISPSDNSTTNYIVISGSLMLQPQIRECCNAWRLQNNMSTNAVFGMMYVIPSIQNESWHGDNLFQPMWWTCDTPKSTPKRNVYDVILGNTTQQWWGLEMPKEDDEWHGPAIDFKDHEQTLVFRGDQNNYDSDAFNKVPILECELIIGDKRLIEVDKLGGMYTKANADYSGNNFKWVKVGQEPTETYDGVTTKNTTFTIGFDPEFEDYIYNQMYDFTDTCPHSKINATGMAIPVKKSDELSGQVKFKIIGPCNTGYNLTLRRHPSFWRHTAWGTENIPILKYCQNIIIKDFEIKLVSDSNQNEVMQEKDLVYISAETDDFVNNQEVDFKIFTALSSDEYVKKGMQNKVYLNTVVDMTTGGTSGKIYNKNTNELALAEEHYIDEYYREFNTPRIILETDLEDNDVQFDSLFDSVPLKKTFYVQSINRNLRNHTAQVKLKEMADFYVNFSDPVFAAKVTNAYGSDNYITPKQAKSVTTTSTLFTGDTNVTNAQYGSFGLTSIDDNAFNGCTSLSNVDIPSSVTSIGNNAFKDTTSLSAVNIPNSVTTIGESAFENSGITKTNIPSSVTEIKDGTYKDSSLSTIIISNGITSIGDEAFSGSDLTEIELPNSVTEIGEGAFANCQNLTKVVL